MNKQIEEIKRKAVPILKKYPIKRAGVFGSYTRGTQRPDSDIDMLVELDEKSPITFFQYLAIEDELEDKLKKKVDLVQYKKVRKELSGYILPNEIRIYEKNN